MMLADWDGGTLGCPKALDHVKACVYASGLFDLAPVQQSYANEALQLTDAELEQCSPLRHVAAVSAKCSRHKIKSVVVYGEDDPWEFRRQSKAFVAGLNAGMEEGEFACREMDIAAQDHFDTVEKLALQDYSLTKAILDMCA